LFILSQWACPDSAELEAAFKRLQRENNLLRQERGGLNKAISIFSYGAVPKRRHFLEFGRRTLDIS
jgi:hypothetical protein